MNKIFNVEIDGQITLPDGRKLGPFEETTVNVVQPSEGGSDPIVENAKQTGGFGYTEQGEQTVIVDNESVTTINAEVVDFASGVFGEPVILEGGSNYSVIFNDSEYVVTCEDSAGGAYVGAKITADGVDFSVYPFMIGYSEGQPTVLATQSGGTYKVTIKKSSNTIHKIDEKYLPQSGGGAMVVVPCTLNRETMDAELTDTGVAVMDKINTDYQNGNIYPVICNLLVKIGGLSIDTYINLNGFGVTNGSVGLSFVSNGVVRSNFESQIVQIVKVRGEWVVEFSIASIPLESIPLD